MRIPDRKQRMQMLSKAGFGLVEVVFSTSILGVVLGGVMMTYARSTRWTEWNAHSMAAQSLAVQAAEQARAAKWEPNLWPQKVGPGEADELGLASYVQVNQMDVPRHGTPIFATNYVSITTVSENPRIRQIRSDCVWRFMDRGLFTNSVFMLRAPDQ